MILYHFTKPELLDSILREGLKASAANAENDLTGGKPVVWLTTRDTLVPSLKARKIILARGILCGPKCSNLPEATVCLRVVLGSHSRRLAHHLTWLRKHSNGINPDDPLLQESGASNWVYFGDIPPAKLSVFKYVARGMTYWALEHNERWHLDGAEIRFDPPELEDDLLAGRVGPPDYVEACRKAAQGDE
jgi:hypothetical protein